MTFRPLCGILLLLSYAGMAELADAPDLGSGEESCRFDPCYPYQQKNSPRGCFFVGLCNRARHVRERICAAYSFEDTTARSNPRQVHRPPRCFLLVCVIEQDIHMKEYAQHILLRIRPQGRILGRSIDHSAIFRWSA